MRPRVLIVEDEYLVALMVEEMLASLGYDVAQVAPTLEAALAAAEQAAFDIAILDLNLNGSRSVPVAEMLSSRGIPFIFATGYGPAGLDASFEGTPTLQKPFHEDELRQALLAVAERA